jgi:hypothetical protein
VQLSPPSAKISYGVMSRVKAGTGGFHRFLALTSYGFQRRDRVPLVSHPLVSAYFFFSTNTVPLSLREASVIVPLESRLNSMVTPL